MAVTKVGTLIKEARNKAGLSQQALAELIPGLTASEVSRAERGEKELTQEELKAIAKATGVTQKSLLEAAKESAAPAKKETTTSKKETTSSKKETTGKTTASEDSMKLTATEKKLVEAYRKADSEARKQAMKILKGEAEENAAAELISSLLGTAMESFLKK